MKGVVMIEDRSAVHVIPRSELRYVEVVHVGGDGWALKYQLAGTVVVRSVEWKGESRPASLRDDAKVTIGDYNQSAAAFVLTILTRGHGDVHLERRTDNVFLVRSGLVEDDARVVLCRKFIAEMALTAAQTAVPEEARSQILHEIHAAARDLVLPDWYPVPQEAR